MNNYFLFVFLFFRTFFCIEDEDLTLSNFLFFGRHDERRENFGVYHIYKTDAFTNLNGGISARDYIVGYYFEEGKNNSRNTGKWLRERYVGEDKLLQDNEFSKLYRTKFLKSDYPRISEFATLLSEGMYGIGSALPLFAEPRLFAREICPKGFAQLNLIERSMLSKYPNYRIDEFEANLQAQNPPAYQWYVDVWIPRVEPFLAEGVRLRSMGGIGFVGASIQSNPGTLEQSLLGSLVQFDEAGDPTKFLGCFLVVFNDFVFPIVSPSANDLNAFSYVHWLVDTLIYGLDDESETGVFTSPDSNVVAVIAAHHSESGYVMWAMNSSSYEPYSEGDFGLWERFEDHLGNYYIKTFFGKDGEGSDLDLRPVYINSCENPYICTEQEFIDNIQYWLNGDPKSECQIEPRPIENVIINSWGNGGIYNIEIIPGVNTFGWNVKIDFDTEDFQIDSYWNADFISKQENSIFLKNPSNYNYQGTAAQPLDNDIGIQLQFLNAIQPNINRIWFNDIVCL